MNDHFHRSAPPARTPGRARRAATGLVLAALALLIVPVGCAKYNTYYNARKHYDDAEHVREERLKEGEDISRATSTQKQDYDLAIRKAQKILDEYPGHSLTDDALFLQGKSYQRIASYRMSIRKLDLLFTNFPQTPYLEESIFLQAVNYLMLGDAGRSQDLLDRLEIQFPDSRFQSQALRSSGDNAYALERWQDAVTAYRRFLERFPEAENWDDSAMRLAESLYELERYGEAVDVLQRIIEESPMSDRVFRARLLQARSLVHMGEHDRAEQIVGDIKGDSMILTREGEVTLVEAENLLAQGDRGAAIAMLEGMPEEQLTPEVKPVRADLLGRASMATDELSNEDLERAREYFQEAVTGNQFLEKPEETRALLATIKDYLAAEGRIPDAEPARAAELRLLQANAMLFGFERSRRALDLYTAVAADSAADSLIAPRALYGAMIVHDAYLQNPDSAAVYREELETRFPDSPQAYQSRSGADTDLLAYLLAQEQAALAAAQPDTLIGLEDLGVVAGGKQSPERSALRRRQIYLQRRDPVVYPPPAAAVRARELELARAREQMQEYVQEQAQEQEQEHAQELERAARDDVSPAAAETLSFEEAPADSLAPAFVTPAGPDTAAAPVPVPTPADTVAAPPADETPEEPEQEKPRNWDF